MPGRRIHYRRMAIEVESPEQLGYASIKNNLAESSFTDMRLADYGVDADFTNTVLPYADHLGHERLRRLIAADATTVSPSDVLVTAGAASALFIVSTSVVSGGAHVIVCAPNYATNLETPRAIDADLQTIELRFESGWRLDLDEIEAKLRPETQLVSVTYPNNPTGSMISPDELSALVSLVEDHPTARLLVDETYRELAYGKPLPVAATLSARVVSVSSMSKTYGLPGLRVGWLICRDQELMETCLAAKEQIFISGAVIDEELAARVLERRQAALEHVHAKSRAHLAIVREWLADNRWFEWVEPRGGVVCFPRLRPDHDVDVDRFYGSLFDRHGTYVGPGWWFDQDPRFFRLGFAWPDEQQLLDGLESLDQAAASAARSMTRS
jgi:aspartate/methionine/tyrosine aminotransferase